MDTQVKNKVVVIDEDKCIGCARCVIMCPVQILKMDPEKNVAVCNEEHKCDRLRGCMFACPVGAITIK